MDQVSFFQDTVESVFNSSIKPHLVSVLNRNWADLSLLSLQKRKDYYSVVFDSSVVVRIRPGKTPRLEFPILGSDKYERINLTSIEQIQEYAQLFKGSLQSIIDAIPKDFSCCSRYESCSDRVACINPDKKMAMQCGYRKVLLSGKVFFGKNRNID